jgi:uncharacterized MAPEG superfamily protein
MTPPLLCIAIALALVYAPKIPLSVAMAREGRGYDNRNPRDQQARLTGWGARARAAHMNGFESFPPFAAGVLVAQLGGAPLSLATTLSVVHVVARAIYPVLYIADVASARSAVWFIGFVATWGLLLSPLL